VPEPSVGQCRALERATGLEEAFCDDGDMVAELSSCPACQNEMRPGVVVGRSPGVKFKAETDVFGDLGGILLTSGFFNHSAAAFRCESCGTVVIPGA